VYVPTCENIAAVSHATENAIWVITHRYLSTEFVTYKITTSGIETGTPVVQNIGLNVTLGSLHGQAKISPDGKKYAVPRGNSRIIEVYDLDRTNANLSNRITIPTGNSNPLPYGLEFSPNSELLYISVSSEVRQYNLLAGNETDIINSKTVLAIGSNILALQMGLDDKIYVDVSGQNSLNVINNPNVLGTGANYVIGQALLGGNRARTSLPHFLRSVGP